MRAFASARSDVNFALVAVRALTAVRSKIVAAARFREGFFSALDHVGICSAVSSSFCFLTVVTNFFVCNSKVRLKLRPYLVR